MSTEQREPDDEVQVVQLQEPMVRVLGFRCETCGRRVGVYRRMSQEPPYTMEARDEVERSARNFHDHQTCGNAAR